VVLFPTLSDNRLPERNKKLTAIAGGSLQGKGRRGGRQLSEERTARYALESQCGPNQDPPEFSFQFLSTEAQCQGIEAVASGRMGGQRASDLYAISFLGVLFLI